MSFGTEMICLEKAHYPFKKYPTKQCETVLFPGCNFPSQFPKTTDAVAKICTEHGCGVAYACCGHPLDGYGKEGGTDRVLADVAKRLKKVGCKRVVVLCPNCWKLMKERFELPIISIFEYLKEIDYPVNKEFSEGVLFNPCPDKAKRILEGEIRDMANLDSVETLAKMGCCGLLPSVMSKGPEAVQASTNKILDAAGDKKIYTYCASCLGQFSRMGNNNVAHVLSVLMGVEETPDSANAFKNRASRKFDKNVDPIVA